MHGLKVTTRRMQEGIGLKGGKTSQLYDEVLLEKKKMIELNYKNLQSIGKHLDEVEKGYVTLLKKVDSARPIMDEVKNNYRTDVFNQAFKAMSGVSEVTENLRPESVIKAKETLKLFFQQCENGVKIEYQAYDKARIDYEILLDQLKKEIKDEAKKDALEYQLEQEEEKFQLRKESLMKDMDITIAALPQVYEMAAIAVATVHDNFGKAFKGRGEMLEKLVAENQEKLSTDFATLGLGNKKKTAAVGAVAETAAAATTTIEG